LAEGDEPFDVEPGTESYLTLISVKSAAVGMLLLIGSALMAVVIFFTIYRPEFRSRTDNPFSFSGAGRNQACPR
jgi:hypothetical protein